MIRRKNILIRDNPKLFMTVYIDDKNKTIISYTMKDQDKLLLQLYMAEYYPSYTIIFK